MFITRSVKTLFHKFPSYSYGKFVYENPNATSSKEKRIALKNFLDSTRTMPKSTNKKMTKRKK